MYKNKSPFAKPNWTTRAEKKPRPELEIESKGKKKGKYKRRAKIKLTMAKGLITNMYT